MTTTGNRLLEALRKVDSLRPEWEITIELPNPSSGDDPEAYDSTIAWKSSGGVEVKMERRRSSTGDGADIATISILQSQPDNRSKIEIFSAMYFETSYLERDAFLLLSKYVQKVTEDGRRRRALEYATARQSFFGS
jgi:hypothetical protein